MGIVFVSGGSVNDHNVTTASRFRLLVRGVVCAYTANVDALIAFQHVTLIDGTGAQPVPDATVAVRDRHIVYAGEARTLRPSLEEDILNLDFTGKYLIPGLIDSHVHLAGNAKADDATVALTMLANARKDLAAGITTVRDLGGWHGVEFAVRESIERGEFTGPRLVLGGRIIAMGDPAAPRQEGMYLITKDAEDIRRAVREQIEQGADLVHLRATAEGPDAEGGPDRVVPGQQELSAAVDEAHKFERTVAAHAQAIDAIRLAVASGTGSIQHGTFLHQDTSVIEEMARRGTYLVPTLRAAHASLLADNPKRSGRTVDKNPEMQDSARTSLRLAYESGVPIVMGSNSGAASSKHGDNGLEVWLMQEAGMQAMDALRSATSVAAKALDLEARTGCIAEGKLADMLVLDVDPLGDLRRLADSKSLRAVFLEGQLVARRIGDPYPKSLMARDCLTIG
jgi:imidazolonepropionase-like amidohydrolase